MLEYGQAFLSGQEVALLADFVLVFVVPVLALVVSVLVLPVVSVLALVVSVLVLANGFAQQQALFVTVLAQQQALSVTFLAQQQALLGIFPVTLSGQFAS